ncbi:hypothetical protein CI105_03495 [Candidatus Izimaplasma bacterium ZiA1]|uniref:endonuclease/exonuclease/phosphatase family protein n=1 Tax=Candidatus Izimoplasma sp. ZiA1 TaxID=2024899 RepID=UPI000BAA6E91|nr:hypothetical protein CI105_03495 [Candidatus Izimaplasma bacterium ZiA1]
MKKIFKISIRLVLVLVFLFVGFVGYIIVTDFDPALVENSEIINNLDTTITGNTFSVTTFNIGYGGLDKDQDFFLDGGTMSRTSSEEQTEENIEQVISFIETVDSDFYFLQEVDVKGTRSANVNQVKGITDYFSDYTATFSYNFKAKWIPIPVMNPLGSAYSGLLNLSKYQVESSTRYRLPGDEPFPRKYFDLDRSVMEDVYDLGDGKTLYMINIHLSAYDQGGLIRAEQVQFLIDHINEIYDEENTYVIFGGDWNHLLDNSLYTEDLPEWVAILPDELFDTGFSLAFDGEVNTVRSDDTPYVEGINFETVIDGFLVSPNITVVDVTGNDLGFENSDHNPVTLTFSIGD